MSFWTANRGGGVSGSPYLPPPLPSKKGQIPPWAKPQLKTFCVEDTINNAILDAIESAELTALDGEDKKAEVLEDVKAIIEGYKVGTPLRCVGSRAGVEGDFASALNPLLPQLHCDAFGQAGGCARWGGGGG